MFSFSQYLWGIAVSMMLLLAVIQLCHSLMREESTRWFLYQMFTIFVELTRKVIITDTNLGFEPMVIRSRLAKGGNLIYWINMAS